MTVVQESHSEALARLLQVARESGVRLKRDAQGGYWATSASEADRIYPVTATSCGCRGFQSHGRCRHLAALMSHLGTLEAPAEVVEPVIELTYREGSWVSDELVPAGSLRWVRAQASIRIGGTEIVRISGDTEPTVVVNPGTVHAVAERGNSTLYATVVAWLRMIAPDANLDRLLADAELFHPAEFIEEAELAVA